MSKSRKNSSRGELRRRRQLREQHDRSEGGEEKEEFQIPSEKKSKNFLYSHSVEIFFLVMLIVGIATVMSYGPDILAQRAISDSASELVIMEAWQWDEKYPLGYKIIAIKGKSIIMTKYDTLPKELKIDWKKVNIARIEANQLTQTIEKIMIEINGIQYEPANIFDRSVYVTLSRKIGFSTKISQLGKYRLIAKIVKDEGEYTFCLIGFKR